MVGLGTVALSVAYSDRAFLFFIRWGTLLEEGQDVSSLVERAPRPLAQSLNKTLGNPQFSAKRRNGSVASPSSGLMPEQMRFALVEGNNQRNECGRYRNVRFQPSQLVGVK